MSIGFRRDNFEQAIAGQVETTLDAVQRALEDAGMSPEDVDEVVLVGGSTRIGVIQRQLEELFGDKLVQPRDDLIARGAAVQAHRLTQQAASKEEDVPHHPLPPATREIEKAVTETEDEHALVTLPPEPDVESLFVYARQLAKLDQNEAAVSFLEELERRSQALREQLSGE
jgi:molecular chaperone DnaK (HSP70)